MAQRPTPNESLMMGTVPATRVLAEAVLDLSRSIAPEQMNDLMKYYIKFAERVRDEDVRERAAKSGRS